MDNNGRNNKGKGLAEFDGSSWQEWLFKAKAFFTRREVLEFMSTEDPEMEAKVVGLSRRPPWQTNKGYTQIDIRCLTAVESQSWIKWR
jgi:hypothetical protein